VLFWGCLYLFWFLFPWLFEYILCSKFCLLIKLQFQKKNFFYFI
jgi:hypothetical protein